MSSKAKVPVGSSSRQVYSSKRDVTGRSRIIGASSVNSSRRVNGSVANVNGGSGHGPGRSTRVYIDGVDVTPQSLLVSRIKPSTPSGGHDPRGKGRGKGNRSKHSHAGASVAGASVMGASVLFSNASTTSADNDSDNESSSSVVGGGNMSSRGPRKETRPRAADHAPSNSAAPSANQEDEENSRAAVPVTGPTDIEDEDAKDEAADTLVAGSAEKEVPMLAGAKSLTASAGAAPARAPRAPVTIRLAETATEMLLELRSVCVAQDAANHVAVVTRNKRYQAVCAQKKGSDKYVHGRAQTLQLASKAKEVMTAPPATRDAACVATDWDIYDCGKLEEETNVDADEVGVSSKPATSADPQAQTQSSEGQPKDTADGSSPATPASSGAESGGVGNVGNGQLKQQVDEIVGATIASPGCVLDVDGDIVDDLRARQHQKNKTTRKVRDKHGAYSQRSRMFDSQRSTAVAAMSSSSASVVPGGGSSGNVPIGASQDLAAAGEERIYHLPVSATSIDFSTTHPYLLAVGFADGVVSIYDTRKDDAVSTPATSTIPAGSSSGAENASSRHVPVPIATSSGMSGKHLDAVWQVRWVARGGGESVVSVSADGRVVEWSLKKGLSYSDLMTLKRAPNPLLGGVGTAATGTNGGGGGGGNDGVISRQASGRCLTFASRADPSVYFVGTEDGLVHKCSVSYNEQYLQTYIGHSGPVYQLLVSPFCNDLFLSCSSDWSLKLWHQAESHGNAALTFHSVDLAQAVLGASWSPTDAALFAAVAEDGRIELWDLAQSTLDPIVRHFPKKFISVATPVPQPTDGDDLLATTSPRDATPKGDDASPLTDTYRDPNAVAVTMTQTLVEVPLECTTVAFAPKAPVLVVGDSTGDVTVYRVPAQVSTTCNSNSTEGTLDMASVVEEQAARLLSAIHPNKNG
ncbi:WD repeat-containing protein 78 [Phytophthora boehmeriae]|uniref:WD repeat-containing protein 78 n=1 Tax=Phytophthora boehmeriae TaxID=109152 RepID=A0A8T1WVJ5_9STRA|nr:WD repeat-containing protein 78 [Phytophthora boehmeriae]